MGYQTLYRRFRPRNFSDFVGQSHVITTLSNAIATNRVAHAYLFTGPRGTGKTSAAKIFAKALNCLSPVHREGKPGEPCDSCSNCVRINEGTFMDVFEIDGASNRGIDEIRELREKVKFAPAEGKYKIYIIDEVHMLTAEAFNALLKTLEEPPQYVIFILATTEVHKIPATILSRCQRFDFKRFTVAELKGRLAQILETLGTGAEEEALELIAIHSEGGMRDAISLLEQSLDYSRGELRQSDVRAILGLVDAEVIAGMSRAIAEQDTAAALRILNDVSLGGKDLFQFGRSLVEHFRKLLLDLVASGDKEAQFKPDQLIAIIETIAAATNEVKRSLEGSLPLELAIIKLTAAAGRSGSLESRVARLEEELRALQSAAPAPERPQLRRNEPAVNPQPKPSPALALPGKEPAGGDFQWELFLEAVKQKKRTLAALIQEGKPLGVKNGVLMVGFPPNLKFHLENLALPQNKELLEKILQEVAGIGRISCVPLSDTTTPVEAGGAPDALTKAVQMFGGEVKSVTKGE